MSAHASAPPPDAIGPYRIVTRLAAGGMAEVFLAVRRGASGFERAVVVKRMLPHLAEDPELSAAIVDEAQLMARLRHPNVASIHDLALDGTSHFLVLEYLRGESLSGLLRRLRARGERLEPALAAHIIAEACAGLHAAHELTDDDGTPLGVVHRDVSPQNVFITFDGEVKVIDFGIARFSHRASARTKTGIAKGKFAYMAPEQFTGEPLDRRSDVFALGALLHELLTGERLFARDSDMQVLNAILQDAIVPPSERWPAIPASLDGVCMRALARTREDRYPTADALRVALSELMPVVDPGQHAHDRLIALMRRVLADRWNETGELLRRATEPSSTRPTPLRLSAKEPSASAAAGHVPDIVPSPALVAVLSEPEIEIVEIEDAAPALRPTAAAADRPPHRRRISQAAVGALAVAAALASLAMLGPGAPATTVPVVTPRTDAPPLPPVPEPPVVASPPADALPSTVHVHVETIPPGARIRAGDRALGTTPCELELERSMEPVEVSIERGGYLPARELIVPSVDARVRIHLTRARTEPRRPRATPVFYSFD